MRSRFLLLPPALLLALGQGPGALAADDSGTTTRRDDRPATREDVLAGEASRNQALELLADSVEAAGGETVQASVGADAVGGYVYPITSIDLDGDGDDETLLSQYSERSYLVAVDDRGVLWKERQPRNAFIFGVLVADLSPAGGLEALLFAQRFGQSPQAGVIAVGAEGLLWKVAIPTWWFEVNGLVQADDDPSDEIALTSWGPAGDVTVHTFDGEDGTPISALRSTPQERVPRSWAVETFVTDGPADQSDEAVFLTSIPTGFYAERRSLADGSQVTSRVAVNAPFPQLYQGSDHTGDGRRDGFAQLATGYGMFDAATLQTSWTVPATDEDTYAYPFPAGDLDGMAGEELCVALDRWVVDSETWRTLEAGAGVRCHAGTSGAVLWEASRSTTFTEQQGGYASTWVGLDLDADGHPDPILQTETYECGGSVEEPTCETTDFEAVALSGVDGAVLWGLTDPAAAEKIWGLTESNLDGISGDDGLDWVSGEEETPDAQFAVRNGLTLAPSWDGVIDTGELRGNASAAVGADLDADSTEEAVVTATAYEILGDPECNGPCHYELYAYVAAFEPGGKRLWQLEL